MVTLLGQGTVAGATDCHSHNEVGAHLPGKSYGHWLHKTAIDKHTAVGAHRREN
jgi:hypothetical protein